MTTPDFEPKLAEFIKRLYALQPGWHATEDNKPIKSSAIKIFEKCMRLLVNNLRLPIPSYYPQPIAYVRAEWTYDTHLVALFFYEDKIMMEIYDRATAKENSFYFSGSEEHMVIKIMAKWPIVH